MGDMVMTPLEAFQKVTGWSNDEVFHYAGCERCDPFEGGHCPDWPHEHRWGTYYGNPEVRCYECHKLKADVDATTCGDDPPELRETR